MPPPPALPTPAETLTDTPAGAPTDTPADTPDVVVIGGANLDLLARAQAPLQPGDSNLAQFIESPGGVGRNIAERLAQLGVPVALLGVVGDDEAGRLIHRHAQAAGIGVQRLQALPGRATARYVSLLQPDGTLMVAVNDMAITQAMTPAWLQGHAPWLRGAGLLLVEANLPADTLASLAAPAEGIAMADGIGMAEPTELPEGGRRLPAAQPIWADAVSAAKCQRLQPLLPRLQLLKANRLEARQLTGLAESASPAALADALHRRGLPRLALSLGAEGLLLSQRGPDGALQQQHQPAPPLPPGGQVNGAGDALLAGLLHAHRLALPLPQAAACAVACAARALAGLPLHPGLTGFNDADPTISA